MLSIDEAIERLKCMRLFMQIEDSENDSKFLEDDYIANDMAIEALEELKEARKGFNENRKAGYKHGYSDGYNKAIDDFAEQFIYKAVCEGCSGCCGCYEECKQSECEDYKYYMQIAEQLKAGGKNVNNE